MALWNLHAPWSGAQKTLLRTDRDRLNKAKLPDIIISSIKSV